MGVVRLLLDRPLSGRFLLSWSLLAVLALLVMRRLPRSLYPLFDLPFLLNGWSLFWSTAAALLLREYRRESAYLHPAGRLGKVHAAGVVSAIAGGGASWTSSLSFFGAFAVLFSWVALGYCATEARRGGRAQRPSRLERAR